MPGGKDRHPWILLWKENLDRIFKKILCRDRGWHQPRWALKRANATTEIAMAARACVTAGWYWPQKPNKSSPERLFWSPKSAFWYVFSLSRSFIQCLFQRLALQNISQSLLLKAILMHVITLKWHKLTMFRLTWLLINATVGLSGTVSENHLNKIANWIT